MPLYAIKLEPCRENLPATLTEYEASVIQRHLSHLQKLTQERRLLLAGRDSAAVYGIVIFEAKDEAEARRVLDEDPAIQAGLFSGHLGLFQLSLGAPELNKWRGL